jgi:hypothetical protein
MRLLSTGIDSSCCTQIHRNVLHMIAVVGTRRIGLVVVGCHRRSSIRLVVEVEVLDLTERSARKSCSTCSLAEEGDSVDLVLRSLSVQQVQVGSNHLRWTVIVLM